MQDLLRFSDLPDYAFPRLRTLLENVKFLGTEVPMHIGEPTHNFPEFVMEKILENSIGFNSYPPNDGIPGLLSGISNWISKRYKIPELDYMTNIISLNGTREGLFNAAIALSPITKNNKIPCFKKMKFKLKKSLEKNETIFKIIKNKLINSKKSYFNFKVNISKQKYIAMIKSRYISCLLNMSVKDIAYGINELNYRYKKNINFTDTLKCIAYRKS